MTAIDDDASEKNVSTFTYAHDGLRLSGRLHGFGPGGASIEARLPLVCLPGLTRNARDFDAFADAVRALDPSRPVVAFDYRGRGRSNHADPQTYAVPVEAADVIAGLDHLGISRAIIVGTSRGALIVHILAAMALDRIAGAVLNDAGPRIEVAGLELIRDTVGRPKRFASWAEAEEHVTGLYRDGFPALSRADFARMTHAIHVEQDGAIVADCDPKLLEAVGRLDLSATLPELWEQFALLKDVPVMAIRGGNSQLFAATTLDRMGREHPGLESMTVDGQAHAPFLETAGLPNRIADFAKRVDQGPTS